MPRKKKSVEENTSTKDSLVANLIEGTEFNFIKQSESVGNGSLSNKPKVETPIYALNDLLGGGLPLGAIVEVYGPSASGKSTIIYETLGNFQRQYSEGVSFIIDSETSTDDSRLRALGVDPMRSPRMGATTLEEDFEQIIKILKKMTDDTRYTEFPVFILWDELLKLCPTTV
jgi:RecA/RadA recombinase